MTNLRSLTRRLSELHDPETAAMERLALRMLTARDVGVLPDDEQDAVMLMRVVRHAIDAGFPAGGSRRDFSEASGRHPAFDACPSPDSEFHELRKQLDALIPGSIFD